MKTMYMPVVIVLLFGVSACGARDKTSAKTLAPDTVNTIAEPSALAAAVAADKLVAASEGQGLNGLSIRVFDAFKRWSEAATASGSRLRPLASHEADKAASAVFQEERDQDGACQSGWLWLEVGENSDGSLDEVRATRFGGDCCGDAACERTSEGHHLHLLRALAREDWAAVALHIPDEGAITFLHHTPEGEARKTISRVAIAEGKVEIPGCGSLLSRPSCETPVGEGEGFTCRCEGGGTQVTYSYQLPSAPRGLAIVSLISVEAAPQ